MGSAQLAQLPDLKEQAKDESSNRSQPQPNRVLRTHLDELTFDVLGIPEDGEDGVMVGPAVELWSTRREKSGRNLAKP